MPVLDLDRWEMTVFEMISLDSWTHELVEEQAPHIRSSKSGKSTGSKREDDVLRIWTRNPNVSFGNRVDAAKITWRMVE